MHCIKMRAPAKINLTLEIGAKRDDGYHSLTSVMSHISLFDELLVSKTDEGVIDFQSNAPYLKNNDKNLCVLAAKKFFELCGIKNAGVKIELKKIIPTNSGMGGGSTDAAAVIKCMENLFGKLDEKSRENLAASLGSDVPFCLTDTSAVCEGRGEKITPFSFEKKRIYAVVAKNAVKVSTSSVYADFDVNPVEFTGSHSGVVQALKDGDNEFLRKSMCNVFEKNIFAATPEVEKLRNKIYSLGAFASQMTGAGPTVFGLFEKRTDAENALEVLRKEKVVSYSAYIL